MKATRIRQVLLSVVVLLAMTGALALPQAEVFASQGHGNKGESPRLGPLPQVGKRSQLLGTSSFPAINALLGMMTTTPPCQNPLIDLKLLVISADGNEADLPAIRQTLDYLGAPYTVWVAQSRPGQLTSQALASGCHAFYQGVILSTGDLGYVGPGGWTSALTQSEWAALHNFEASFRVRQLSWYTYPTATYGFGSPSAVDTSTSPLTAQFTADGRAVFSYVNSSGSFQIRDVYTYLAAPLDAATRPLLQDAQGHALVAVHTYPDGRQNLAVTFDSNPYLLHTLTLAYGLVSWVTNGVFLGERRVSLAAQVDDVFIEDDIWHAGRACGSTVDNTGAVYRMTAADVRAVVAWQKTIQRTDNFKDVRLDLAFNGWGTTGIYAPDTLTKVLRQQAKEFKWINHTYDHENWDAMSYADAFSEVSDNNAVAKTLKLGVYDVRSLVTPDVSGLTNPAALQAAYDAGVRFVVSDTSRAGYANPSPNAGLYNQGTYNGKSYRLLMIPRHPVNLYYNVSEPSGWVAEDNCLYPPGAYGHVDSYDQLLERESRVLLSYLLRGDVDPLMFHQPNLGAYDGTHTLLGDLLDRTLQKYADLVNLPVLSPTMDQLAKRVSDRMLFDSARVAGLQVSIVPGKMIVFLSPQDVTVPVTGMNAPGAQVYGGQPTAYITLRAGQPRVLPLR